MKRIYFWNEKDFIWEKSSKCEMKRIYLKWKGIRDWNEKLFILKIAVKIKWKEKDFEQPNLEGKKFEPESYSKNSKNKFRGKCLF